MGLAEHVKNCQDPKCQAGAHEVDWTIGLQERRPRVVNARDDSSTILRMPVSEPAPDSVSEREREALELRNIYRCTPPAPLAKADTLADSEGKIWLIIRDRAEAIFKAKVERLLQRAAVECEGRHRAEQERDAARAEVERLAGWKESALKVLNEYDIVIEEILP